MRCGEREELERRKGKGKRERERERGGGRKKRTNERVSLENFAGLALIEKTLTLPYPFVLPLFLRHSSPLSRFLIVFQSSQTLIHFTRNLRSLTISIGLGLVFVNLRGMVRDRRCHGNFSILICVEVSARL